jgi:hypothetical protein
MSTPLPRSDVSKLCLCVCTHLRACVYMHATLSFNQLLNYVTRTQTFWLMVEGTGNTLYLKEQVQNPYTSSCSGEVLSVKHQQANCNVTVEEWQLYITCVNTDIKNRNVITDAKSVHP